MTEQEFLAALTEHNSGLRLAHVLHGRACKLFYDSPVTGPVQIFNHDPQ